MAEENVAEENVAIENATAGNIAVDSRMYIVLLKVVIGRGRWQLFFMFVAANIVVFGAFLRLISRRLEFFLYLR